MNLASVSEIAHICMTSSFSNMFYITPIDNNVIPAVSIQRFYSRATFIRRSTTQHN